MTLLLDLRIAVDNERAKRELEQTGKAVTDLGDTTEKTSKGIGGSFGRIGEFAAGALTADALKEGARVIVDFGKEIIDLGATLEAQRAKSKTVFGDQLESVQTWAKGSAHAMGLTESAAVSLATAQSDLLKPMGFNAETAAKMATELVGLSGTLSKWSGGTKSAAEVSEILTKAMLGEADGLKALGISLSAADIDARVAADGNSELTGKALEMAKATAVQALIIEKSTDAIKANADGAFAAGDAQRELGVRFDEAKEALANRVYPVWQAFTEFLVNTVVPAFEAVGGWMVDNTGTLKLLASVGLAAVTVALVPVVTGLATLAATTLASTLFEVSAALFVFTTDLLAVASAEGVLAAATVALETTMLPVILAVGILGGALFALQAALDHSSEAADKFIDEASRDIDTSSWDDLVRASDRVHARIAELNRINDESRHSFGGVAGAVVDLLIPFHDVEGSLKDTGDEQDTLTEKMKESEKFTRANGIAMNEYATATAAAAIAADQSAPSLDNIGRQQRAAAAGTEELTGKLRLLAEQQDIDLTKEGSGKKVVELYAAAQIASPAVVELTDAQKKFTEEATTATEKVDAFNAALDALFGISLTAAETNDALAKGFIDLVEGLDKQKAAVKGLTDVQAGANDAQKTAILESNALIQDQVGTIESAIGVRFEEVAGIYGEQAALKVATDEGKLHRQQLIDTMIQHGYSKTAAEDYVNQLGLTPANIDTAANLHKDQATADADALKGKYGSVPGEVGTEATMDTGPAERSLKRYEVILNNFKEGAALGGVIGGQVTFPGRAAGGPVLAGRGYLVGERGPELFMPRVSGRIVPGGAAASSAGPTVINVNVSHTGLAVDNPRLQRDLVETLSRFVSRNGPLQLPIRTL